VIRLTVAKDAQRDVASILNYLREEANPVVAEEFGYELRRTLLRLTHFPDSGAPRRDFGPHVRIAIVRPYLLFYEHTPRARDFILLRVLHSAANVTAELLMRSP
jgi:plasmid stabilization system protein ParE